MSSVPRAWLADIDIPILYSPGLLAK